jgi:hypothetical protein
MSKVLVLLIGVAMTWALVANVGWIALGGCSVAALLTLMLSTEIDEQELELVDAPRDNYSAVPSVSAGGF